MTNHLNYDGKVKQIGIQYHFIREQIVKNIVQMEYCTYELMVVDALTKALPRIKFEFFKDVIHPD